MVHDNNHRSIVDNIINQNAIHRNVNKLKPRILQSHRTVSDKSVVHDDNTRGVRPLIKDMKPAAEDPQNNTAHGFNRSAFCDNTNIFKILPTIPNINIIIAK